MDKKNQKERWVQKRRQAEEALRASEVRHQAILEWALDAIISVDREGRIIEFNKAAETMFGHASKDAIGKEMTTLIIPPALRERHRAGWKRHLATGTTSIICKRIEITAMRADGAEFPIELIVTRFGPDGNPTFTAFIRDITERKHAEETIRESAKLVRAIFEQAPIGIAIINSHTGQFIEINNKYCGIVGFSATEMLRRTFQDITHPDDLQGDLNNMKLLLEGKIKSFEMDKRYIRKDNSVLWVHLTVVPLWRGEEQPRLHIAMVEDITERKETEESLQESQRFLSALIGNLPGMVYRCRNDRNWTVTYISEGCVSLTGYHPSDFLDNQIHYGRLVHPDDQDRIWNEVQTALRKKKSFMLTYRIRTAAGEEKWVWEQGRSVLASNGELLFLEGFVTDITERKEIAEKLRATEMFLRVITENVPDAIFMKDLAGRYLMANPAALRVLCPEDSVPDKVIGKTDMDLLPRKTAEEFARTDKLLFESGKPVKRLEEEVTPDGTRMWEAVKVPYLDEQGKMRGLIGVSRDITERKRAESLVAGENRVLGMIATGAPLPAVLEMLVRFIEEQSEGMLGSILLLDEEGKTLRHGAAPSLPEAYTKAIDGVCIGPRVGSCGTAAYRREPVIVSDIASDPLWVLYRDLALSHGLRACWSTPIFSRSGAVLGTFAMYYREARSPNPVETQLIEIATRIAGIATERHRAEEALRASEERFDLAVRGANEGLWDGHPLPGEPWYSPRTPLWWSPRVREMLGFSQEEFPDVLEIWAALLHPEDKERVFAALAAHIESKVPYEAEYRLRTKQGGYRWFRARGQAIWDHAGKLLRMAGNLDDITERKQAEEERAQLFEEVQDSHDRLQRLSGRLLEVQEEERRRLARDLHDQTGQSLTSLLIGLRTLEDASTLEATRVQARNLRTITAQALDEVKRLAIGLRPALLDDLGLEAALKRLAKESAKTYGVSVDLHVKGLPNHRLSPPVETGLYRLAQEALTNTGRHAAARNVSVLLTCSESSVKLIVEDDGRGFDVEKALRLPGSSNHLGLLGMRERVALLNGTISVESTPGGGTTIYVQLPLETRPS